jgi:pyruvate/2-oxoglutarate dehydrogenase complex dihydrolipoamide acyltransferase (E2) component
MKTTKTTKTTKTIKTAKAPEPAPAVKPVEPAPAPAPRPKPAPAAKAPSAPRVTFRLKRPGARTVAVAGTFNDWSASAARLRAAPDGVWSIELALTPGVYEYRFVVDGEWISDPAAGESVPNSFGGVNSVVRVGAY